MTEITEIYPVTTFAPVGTKGRTVDGVETVVVPVVPNLRMRVAGAEVHDQRPSEVMAIYRAMIDAAPALENGKAALADATPNNNPSPLSEAPAEGRVVDISAISEMFGRWQSGYAFDDDKEEDVDLFGRVDAEIAALTTPPAPSPDALAKAVEEAFDASARIVEENQLMHTSNGDVLQRRSEGNRNGLAYAAAIRKLARARATSGESHD